MAQDFKDTLQLPKTDFPMRAGLPQREPTRIAHWEKLGLYDQIQKRRASAQPFVLHDGPPFTNGDLHIGHALNKTLKEIILRFKSMQGFRTPYVPGWDCHGLPIEQKISREIQEKKLSLTSTELREKCGEFSELWISRQTEQFKRMGVLADWKNQYKTKDPAFEAAILRLFASFAERRLVYRSKKPVYYSIPFETALAEAEVEYKEHVSPSIWVKFEVRPNEAARFGLPNDKPLFVVIWTTTPWTIPANLAIALHPELDYVVVDPLEGKFQGERFIVAEGCYLSFLPKLGTRFPATNGILPNDVAPIIAAVKGEKLEYLNTRHPFIDRASPIVLAKYVTTDSGTGCVHTAPGHGSDDFLTGKKYGLPIYCPIGDEGRYTERDNDYDKSEFPDLQVPADLVRLTTLETVEDLAAKRTSPANIGVLKMLGPALLHKENYKHQYPHCWRSKTPVIFRATHQWFVALDSVRETALAEIKSIGQHQGWTPAWGEARIRGAVESRPDWCISRNRRWGVPIPVFYHKNTPLGPDASVIIAIADKVEKEGAAFWREWFENLSSERILEGITLPEGWPAAPLREYSHCQDTFDVWIDSGSSHAAVLRRHLGGTSWPADLYLEGSDQHRGWFQSSLWTSVVAYGKAPFKGVLTHGFILDEERKKLSKSNSYEKPQTSDTYIGDYGADVIRLWIASQDFRDDIPISKEILSHVGETYRLIRNTFRYQLSNLFDFDPTCDAIPVADLHPIDRWALGQTAELIRGCTSAYEAYEFHRVYQLCNHFCSVTLSATYHDILKDRLYTLGSNDSLRRSSQTAIYWIFQTLAKLLAPILAFTTDEAWAFAMNKVEYSDDSVHLQDWPKIPNGWEDRELQGEFSLLLSLRSRVNAAIEPERAAGRLGKSLDAVVTISVLPGEPLDPVLKKWNSFLPEWFIVSGVFLSSADPAVAGSTNISVGHAKDLGLARCPRCWRWVPALETSASGAVCPRCIAALNL
jgi:isoleucyl-tRNA synthetase